MEDERKQVEKRAELWKAALGEGPGETPGPAGRALLADLRKLWLTREEERGAGDARAAVRHSGHARRTAAGRALDIVRIRERNGKPD